MRAPRPFGKERNDFEFFCFAKKFFRIQYPAPRSNTKPPARMCRPAVSPTLEIYADQALRVNARTNANLHTKV
jgi:hypothetical protein